MWSDGVPGITQRMIEPGNFFVANFTATNSGQSWYHAHSKAIYGDGIRGNFYVRASQDELDNGPWSQISGNSADIAAMKAAHQSPKMISVTDWTHWDSEWGLAEWTRTKTELICVDSVLINGKVSELFSLRAGEPADLRVLICVYVGSSDLPASGDVHPLPQRHRSRGHPKGMRLSKQLLRPAFR